MAIVISALPGMAQTTNTVSSVSTVPEGILTLSLPATASGVTATNYFSLPLSSDPVYSGAVSALTANSISISDTPGWTAGQFATAAAPYFVKFLTGSQAGRVILVTANTTNSLTLDTTDHSSQTVALNTSNFSVAVGDSFELFAGDTLASVFGSSQATLLLKGGANILQADTVSLYSTALVRFQAYYFDTTAGFWKLSGSSANANNTPIYPYSGFAITRRGGEAATSIVLSGRVPEVSRLVKTTGSTSVIYDSTGYPVDVTLAQLNLGPNWTKGTSVLNSDTISVYNAALVRFDTYYQLSSDSTWRKSGGGSADQSSFVIPAGTTVAFLKRGAASGAASFLQPAMPYITN